jgi:hypothetical protein
MGADPECRPRVQTKGADGQTPRTEAAGPLGPFAVSPSGPANKRELGMGRSGNFSQHMGALSLSAAKNASQTSTPSPLLTRSKSLEPQIPNQSVEDSPRWPGGGPQSANETLGRGVDAGRGHLSLREGLPSRTNSVHHAQDSQLVSYPLFSSHNNQAEATVSKQQPPSPKRETSDLLLLKAPDSDFLLIPPDEGGGLEMMHDIASELTLAAMAGGTCRRSVTGAETSPRKSFKASSAASQQGLRSAPSVFSVALPPPPRMGADPELTRGHSVTGAQTSFPKSFSGAAPAEGPEIPASVNDLRSRLQQGSYRTIFAAKHIK